MYYLSFVKLIIVSAFVVALFPITASLTTAQDDDEEQNQTQRNTTNTDCQTEREMDDFEDVPLRSNCNYLFPNQTCPNFPYEYHDLVARAGCD